MMAIILILLVSQIGILGYAVYFHLQLGQLNPLIIAASVVSVLTLFSFALLVVNYRRTTYLFDKILHQVITFIGDQSQYWEKVKKISHDSIFHLHHNLVEIEKLMPLKEQGNGVPQMQRGALSADLTTKIHSIVVNGQQYLQMDDFIGQICHFYMTKNTNLDDLIHIYDMRNMQSRTVKLLHLNKKLNAFSHDLEYLLGSERYPPVTQDQLRSNNVELF